MGILYNGNAWDVQYLSGASGTSTTANVVFGNNVGASGSTFVIPSGASLAGKEFTVIATAGTVTVSGTSPNTINGGTTNLSVSALTGKTLFNFSGNAWISY
jgi:hypothetical protein